MFKWLPSSLCFLLPIPCSPSGNVSQAPLEVRLFLCQQLFCFLLVSLTNTHCHCHQINLSSIPSCSQALLPFCTRKSWFFIAVIFPAVKMLLRFISVFLISFLFCAFWLLSYWNFGGLILKHILLYTGNINHTSYTYIEIYVTYIFILHIKTHINTLPLWKIR